MRDSRQRTWIGSLQSAALAIVCGLQTQPTLAADRVYTIVPDQSSIAISGSVMTDAGTSQIQQQGAGSLTTKYSGTIRTDRTDNAIQFLAGSSIDAMVSGNWQPLPTGAAGSSAADYGGRVSYLFGLVTINFAARNFVGDLSSGVLPLNSAGGFNLSTTSVQFLTGSLAYRSSTGDAGSESIVGESGTMSGMGSLTSELITGGALETLSIPINSSFTIPVGDSTTVNLRLTGEIVATAVLRRNPPGDFNTDGVIDAADYVVWRDRLGTTFTLADYEVWRTHFGQPANSSDTFQRAASGSAAVPEPTILAIAALAIVAIVVSWRGTACQERQLR
jgi:hypothetical protein